MERDDRLMGSKVASAGLCLAVEQDLASEPPETIKAALQKNLIPEEEKKIFEQLLAMHEKLKKLKHEE